MIQPSQFGKCSQKMPNKNHGRENKGGILSANLSNESRKAPGQLTKIITNQSKLHDAQCTNIVCIIMTQS